MSAVDDLRAEALFCSDLQPSRPPSGEQVRTAVAHELLAGDCAAEVAQEFGDHPQAAVERMRWCRGAVKAAFVPAHA